MRQVEPKVFIIGESSLNAPGLAAYLSHVGVPTWDTDASSDVETLVEVMGRGCYKSWEPGLNPNVRKVRKTNADYLANIIKVKHGSVLEHASVNFMICDVSRVFTHELVRHRPGVAISQESLRFVRLDDLGLWAPTIIREDPEAVAIFAETFEHLERLQLQLAEHFCLDDEKDCPDCEGRGYVVREAWQRDPLDSRVREDCSKCAGSGKVGAVTFSTKKVVTSAMRRIAPIGLATNIGWTANIRTIRWCLEARTHPSAEEEIRLVFGIIGSMMQARYPVLFSDFEIEEVDGHPWFKTEASKV